MSELLEKVVREFLIVVIKTCLWSVGFIAFLKLSGHPIITQIIWK